MTDSTIDPKTFRRTCAKYATGICIATLIGTDNLPHGMTVNSFTSVSAVPPLVLVCVDYSSNLLPHFRAASHYGISVLNSDQQDLSNRFAARGQDRFTGVQWLPGQTGVPLIPGALAHMECKVSQVVEAGDHAIFIGELVRAEISDGKPLLFFDSAYGSLA
ncbi:MAG: flavin reductase family protein [Acidimicrobiia bacterium]|nr:flavin reductase family protein [Acidimicrobiia bacterium]